MSWTIDNNWVSAMGKITPELEKIRELLKLNSYVEKYGSDEYNDAIFLRYLEGELVKLCPKLPSREKIEAGIAKLQSFKTDVWQILTDAVGSEYDSRKNRAILVARLNGVAMGFIKVDFPYLEQNILVAMPGFPDRVPEPDPKKVFGYVEKTTVGSFIGITKSVPMFLANECGLKYPSLPSLLIPHIISLAKENGIRWLGVNPLAVMRPILERMDFRFNPKEYFPDAMPVLNFYRSIDDGKTWEIEYFDYCYRVY